MGGTRARAGEIAAGAGLAMGAAAALAGVPALGFPLVLLGFAVFCLTTSLSLNGQIGAGFVAGVLAGLATWLLPSGADALTFVSDVGWLFVQLLKMLVGPLVFLAISSGLASAGSTRGLGGMGARTLALYLGTMALAVAAGLTFVNLFEPGQGSDLLTQPFFRERLDAAPPEAGGVSLSFRGLLQSLLENPLASLASARPPILALVAFAILLGVALVQVGESAEPLTRLLQAAYAVVLRMIGWFVRLAPIGVMAILWSLLGSFGDAGPQSLASALGSVGAFVGVVFLATGFHAFVTLPALAWALGRVRPQTLFHGISEALIVAFSTSSSAATLPVTTRNVEDRLGVPQRVSSFVLPLGSTVNMDGTALYEAIAALFVAGLYGVDLSVGSQAVVFGMSMLMAVGAPAIPSAGMVTMIAVLESVNLPGEAVALLIPLDRLLDTIRTMANVEGDAVVAVCVARAQDSDG